MAFTMYSYLNSTTGDLVISGQEETLGGYAQLSTPSTNPTSYRDWPWYSKRSSIKTAHIGTISPIDVTSTTGMFYGCSSLTSLDLSSFDTSKVTSMDNMFGDCSSITSLDLSSFDTSHVTDMRSMFNGCTSLTSLDLSSFDTSQVTSMSGMFGGCSSLHIIDIPTTATKIVSWLPLDNYYDAATETQYSYTDIPGGSVYVDDLKYAQIISSMLQNREGLVSLADKIRAIDNNAKAYALRSTNLLASNVEELNMRMPSIAGWDESKQIMEF